MHNLANNSKHTRVLNRDDGTPGTKKATIIDTLGFEVHRFIVGFQTVVNDAGVTLRIAHSTANDTATMAVSTATTGAITSDGTVIALSNKELIVEVVGPTKRYLEAQVVIADQNAPIDYIICDQFRADQLPVAAQGASVHASATFNNPVNA